MKCIGIAVHPLPQERADIENTTDTRDGELIAGS
jgi:hypothetical protein